MKKVLLAGAAVALALLVGRAALAHHSGAAFDHEQKVTVQGTVARMDWQSPHARLYVDAKDAAGKAVQWNIELPSPNTLMRRGWTRDSLKPGDAVSVQAHPARDYPNIAVAINVVDRSGKQLFAGSASPTE
jgi:hypothetical protein